jgi:hypothetical protein
VELNLKLNTKEHEDSMSFFERLIKIEELQTIESYSAYRNLIKRERAPATVRETEILLGWANETYASADQIRYILELISKAEI